MYMQVYWSGAPYYAFGQGAASYLSGRRFTRPATGRGYAQYVTEMTAQGSDVLPGAHIPPQSQVRVTTHTHTHLEGAGGW